MMASKTWLGAGVMALGFALLPTGVAHADDVVVEGKYSTEKACMVDGPDTHLESNDEAYRYWYCDQGDDGFWYLHNTDAPYHVVGH